MLDEIYNALPEGNCTICNTFDFNPSSWTKLKTEAPQKMVFAT